MCEKKINYVGFYFVACCKVWPLEIEILSSEFHPSIAYDTMFFLYSSSLVLSNILFRSERKRVSPSGNRTQVSRVTGGDTDHYTNEDGIIAGSFSFYFNFPQCVL